MFERESSLSSKLYGNVYSKVVLLKSDFTKLSNLANLCTDFRPKTGFENFLKQGCPILATCGIQLSEFPNMAEISKF